MLDMLLSKNKQKLKWKCNVNFQKGLENLYVVSKNEITINLLQKILKKEL